MRLDHVNEKPRNVEQAGKPGDNKNDVYSFEIKGSHEAKVNREMSADNSFINFIVM